MRKSRLFLAALWTMLVAGSNSYGQGMPGMPGAATDAPGPYPQIDAKAGNAFGAAEEDVSGARFEFGWEYLFMYTKQMRFPTLVTLGDPIDIPSGALDQPGTTRLFGGEGFGASGGGRFRWTLWVVDPEFLAFDGNFMIMENQAKAVTFQGKDFDPQVLARPYYNVPLELEDADPRHIPGVLQGSTSDTFVTRLMGAEVNMRMNLSGVPFYYEGPTMTLLFGARWFKLDDKYSTSDVTEDLPEDTFITTAIQDNFTTYNNFVGGQVGLQYHYHLNRFHFDLMGKVALGSNRQSIQLTGFTQQLDEGGLIPPAATTNRGFLVQPTNAGDYTQAKIGYMPELSANVSAEITSRIKITVGYTYLGLNNAVRPDRVIDRELNIQQINQFPLTPPLVPGAPQFNETFFWVQWVNLGLELTF